MSSSTKVILLAVMFFISSYAKNTPENAQEVLLTGTVLASGTVKVIMDADSKKLLVFENFRSENGPDIRVWLSPNNNASPYQEIGILKPYPEIFLINSAHPSITRSITEC